MNARLRRVGQAAISDELARSNPAKAFRIAQAAMRAALEASR